MPANTPRGYPYSLPSDPADVPGAVQALAEAVDADAQAVADSVGPRDAFRLSSTARVSFPTWIAFQVNRVLTFDVVDFSVGGIAPTAFPARDITPTAPGFYWVTAAMVVPREGAVNMQAIELSLQNATTTLTRQTLSGPPTASDGSILLQVETGMFLNGTTDFVQVVGSTQVSSASTGNMIVNRSYMSMTRMTES